MGKIVIRQYQDGDKDAVFRLHFEALQPTGAMLPGGPWNDDDLNDIPQNYFNGGEFLVGLIGNQFVCMGALRKKSATVGEIKRMRVHPDYQRRGYGQMMLDKLEARAKELGYTKLCLDTTTKQIAAQALYKKNGYKEVSRTAYAGLEIIFFEKKITPG